MIVSLMLLCACVQKPLVAHQELKLVIASDIHYFLKEYYQECEWFEESMMYGDGKMVTYADEILDAFVAEMKIQKPDLIILTGDLSFNGEKGSHQGLAEHLMKLKDEGIHVAVLPGNHDVDNINAKGYGKDGYMEVAKTDAKDFENIYQDLGYDIAVNKHENSLSYRIDLNDDYSLVMLDTTSHEQTTQTALDIGGLLSEKTYSWLQTELGQIEKENRRPLIAMHHNLVDHNELLNRGYTIDRYQPFPGRINDPAPDDPRRIASKAHTHSQCLFSACTASLKGPVQIICDSRKIAGVFQKCKQRKKDRHRRQHDGYDPS